MTALRPDLTDAIAAALAAVVEDMAANRDPHVLPHTVRTAVEPAAPLIGAAYLRAAAEDLTTQAGLMETAGMAGERLEGILHSVNVLTMRAAELDGRA